MEDALDAFAASGLPGAAAVVLSFVVFFLWREGKEERAAHHRDHKEWETKKDELETKRLHDLKEAHQHRIADSELVHIKMLDVVKQCTTVLETTAAALDGHKDAATEHRDSQREAAEELRKLSVLLHAMHEDVKTRYRPSPR